MANVEASLGTRKELTHHYKKILNELGIEISEKLKPDYKKVKIVQRESIRTVAEEGQIQDLTLNFIKPQFWSKNIKILQIVFAFESDEDYHLIKCRGAHVHFSDLENVPIELIDIVLKPYPKKLGIKKIIRE